MNNIVAAPEHNLIPTRYSLLSRLQNWDDQASWKEFFDTYWRLIYSIALKAGLTEAEAQDVVQETIISVAKNIHKFKRDRTFGSFKGWLRNITRWRIGDQLKRRMRFQPDHSGPADGGEPPMELSQIPDPAAGALDETWEKEWRANLFDAAVERVKQRVKEEHFQIFDLHVIRQWPARRVAVALETTVGQVYLAKFRVLALIKKEIRRLDKGG